MSEPFWRGGFGPLLPDTATVPFGDFDALERRLSTRQYAALIVEPIQGEAGIRIPDANYLRAAQAVCRRYGSLFVLDEVQTGLHRTGPFLAAHHYGLDPDMVVLAKALSGGLVPTAALLMTDEIYGSVFNSLKRSIIHTSTYSENGLSMRAGLATLLTLDAGGLGERSRRMGDLLRSRLRQALSGYQMVREVRGEGLFNGIEFQAPRKLALRVPFEAFKAIHPGMFGQIVVMRLYRDHGILTQMCGNNFLVLKATPPLVVEECHIEKFVAAVSSVVELMHTSASFWTEALGLARRVADI
jgi:ornithine--oxo-acid transaminase